jgi:DDE superfamily endonuclease
LLYLKLQMPQTGFRTKIAGVPDQVPTSATYKSQSRPGIYSRRENDGGISQPVRSTSDDDQQLETAEDYGYGWCAQSERFEALKLGHRTERISMIAAWCDHPVAVPLTFKGYCNRSLVEAWVEQCLVGQLRPGQVGVMDNASFHKSTSIRELIEQAGCTLLFLPSYSLDLYQIFQ